MATRKITIRRIDPISLGKIQGAIFAGFALIIAVFLALAIIAMGLTNSQIALGIGGAIAALIIFPIAYGISGFIAGIIVALVYNLAAGSVGGLQLDFKYDEGQL